MDVSGTDHDELCTCSATRTGDYRLVAEISVSGVRVKYASENALIVR